MKMLHEVDKPGSDVDEYVENLNSLFTKEVQIIGNLQSKFQNFRKMLKDEEDLSSKFYEKKNELMDIFDLNNIQPLSNEAPLLDDLQEVIN